MTTQAERKRKSINMTLLPENKEVFDKIAQELGMTRSRLLEFIILNIKKIPFGELTREAIRTSTKKKK